MDLMAERFANVSMLERAHRAYRDLCRRVCTSYSNAPHHRCEIRIEIDILLADASRFTITKAKSKMAFGEQCALEIKSAD